MAGIAPNIKLQGQGEETVSKSFIFPQDNHIFVRGSLLSREMIKKVMQIGVQLFGQPFCKEMKETIGFIAAELAVEQGSSDETVKTENLLKIRKGVEKITNIMIGRLGIESTLEKLGFPITSVPSAVEKFLADKEKLAELDSRIGEIRNPSISSSDVKSDGREKKPIIFANLRNILLDIVEVIKDEEKVTPSSPEENIRISEFVSFIRAFTDEIDAISKKVPKGVETLLAFISNKKNEMEQAIKKYLSEKYVLPENPDEEVYNSLLALEPQSKERQSFYAFEQRIKALSPEDMCIRNCIKEFIIEMLNISQKDFEEFSTNSDGEESIKKAIKDKLENLKKIYEKYLSKDIDILRFLNLLKDLFEEYKKVSKKINVFSYSGKKAKETPLFDVSEKESDFDPFAQEGDNFGAQYELWPYWDPSGGPEYTKVAFEEEIICQNILPPVVEKKELYSSDEKKKEPEVDSGDDINEPWL